MKKSLFVSLAVAGAVLVPTLVHAQFASSVTAYTQGSGVLGGYNITSSALGAPSTQTVDPDPMFGGTFPVDPFGAAYLSSQIVGIGTGGSMTLHFNTSIVNDPSHLFNLDFIIFGHAGFNITNGNYSGGGITDGSFYQGGDSNVRVSVSTDGLTFYTLNPALTPAMDGLFPTDGIGDPFRPVNPALTAADFSGQDLAGIRSLYNGSAGGTGFDLGWAVDDLNQSVSLASINYVRLDVLSGVAYLDAIAPVPEPTTYALAVLGAGMFLLRRKKN